ncbi:MULTISPECIES: HtaA domain-containing protein [unclassified Leucobacter]|uniref:HtaA domain-containing protein n=1 Tax=unclassified Leucobacter TaxID=2621730 RepID=UPI003019E37C
MFARQGLRASLATLLVSALVAGGALLGGTAASAEELPADPLTEQTAIPEAPSNGTPSEAPAEEPAAPQQPAAETPSEADTAQPVDDTAAAAPSLLAAAPPATLEAVRENGGSLDWGFKASWRGYLAGVGGTQTPYGGATLNPDGTTHFPESAASSFDPAAGTGEIAYTGGVIWDNPAHGFTIALQNPRITIAADGAATVSAEMSTTDTAGADSVARIVLATIAATGTSAETNSLQQWTAAEGVFASTLAPTGVARYQGQATDVFTFSTPAAPPKVWSPGVQVFLGDSTTPLAPGAQVYKGDKLRITGTGFDPAANVGGRGVPIPNTLPQGSYVVFGKFAPVWSPADGVAASARKAGPQGWVLAESVLNQVPNDRGYQSIVRAQWVPLAADGSWTAELTLADPKDAATVTGDYGIYTYGAGGVNNKAQETKLALNYTDTERPKVWSPGVQVFLGDSTTPLAPGAQVYKGDKLRITGTGFDPAANVGGRGVPIPNTLPQGSYVVFGKFAPVWSPADGVAASARKAGPQGWVLAESVLNQVPNDRGYQSIVRAQWVPLAADGSWTAELTLADPKDAATVTGDYGIYTYGAGGVNNKAQETKLALNYTDTERPVAPSYEADLKVFLADGVTPYDGRQVKEGDKLVVKGTGYDPYVNKCFTAQPVCDLGGLGNPIPSDKPQGTFAVFGHFGEHWRPSEGAPSDQRKIDKSNRAWALAKDTLEQDVPAQYRDTIRSEWTEIDPASGSFTWTVTLKEPADLVNGGNFGIYTYAGGVNTKNAAQERMVAINFAGKDRTPKPDPDLTKGGLKWGVKDSFRSYVEGGAGGSISMLGAAKRSGGVFEFPQIDGGSWNAKNGTGDVHYAGGVTFTGHGGALALTLADPQITVESSSRAVLSAKIDNARLALADIDLSKAKRSEDNGAVTWSGAPSTLRAEAVTHFLDFYTAGSQMDPVTFTVGAASDAKPTDPVTPQPKPEPKPETPAPVPAQGTQQAGSLSWGVSSGFAAYATGPIAKGSVTGNGVGGGAGGYVFPQAGSAWNAASHTGTVQYSGVVTFTGHAGLMRETFANPVITVHNALSGTITVRGESYALNLAVAAKSVGANGEATWAGAPVAGAISGGGSTGSGAGGGSFGIDPVTFTVGAVSGANYGTTTVSAKQTKRTPAAAPPATTGVTVVTPAKKLVPGGEIEIEASGFESKERDILVVVYSDPIVLDEAAGADENGTVRWIGTLPEDLAPGTHTITLQGSINAGAVIEVAEKAETVKTEKAKKDATAKIAEQAEPMAAGVLGADAGPVWVWWVAAIALLVIAGATTGLVVVQRRGHAGEK